MKHLTAGPPKAWLSKAPGGPRPSSKPSCVPEGAEEDTRVRCLQRASSHATGWCSSAQHAGGEEAGDLPVLAEVAEQWRAERRCDEKQRVKSAMRRVTHSSVARRAPVQLCRRTARREGAQAAWSGSVQPDRALRFCPSLGDCSAHTPRRAASHARRLQQCAKYVSMFGRQFFHRINNARDASAPHNG